MKGAISLKSSSKLEEKLQLSQSFKTQNEGSDLETLNIDSDDEANVQLIEEDFKLIIRGQIRKKRTLRVIFGQRMKSKIIMISYL